MTFVIAEVFSNHRANPCPPPDQALERSPRARRPCSDQWAPV